MAAISAALVKELRERTGAGMMDCKKALQEADGDIELAIENMRKSGQAKAAKKAGRIAADGVIKGAIDGDVAVLVEINCETDFVARDESFQAFANRVTEIALAGRIVDMEVLKDAEYSAGQTVEQAREALVAKIGENIQPRRATLIQGQNLAVYLHGARIGVVASLTGGSEDLAKDVAMHVAAAKPEFVKPTDVPADVVEKEKAIQIELAMQSGKPAEIAEKMVVGRMAKFTGEISLTGQPFVKDPSISVETLLKNAGVDVNGFVRFEVGEGIEKAETDFAAEVAAQIAAANQQ